MLSGVERVRGEPKRLARYRSSLGTELPSPPSLASRLRDRGDTQRYLDVRGDRRARERPLVAPLYGDGTASVSAIALRRRYAPSEMTLALAYRSERR